jgi:hypothetical protein
MNTNKIANATASGICLQYVDKKKHSFIKYERIEKKQETKKTKTSNDGFNLNPKQVKMYRVSMYGLEAFKESEINNMSVIDKINIKYRQEHTQKIINRYKQHVTQLKINNLLSKLFPNSKIILEMSANNDYYCDGLINYSTFKDLDISHSHIIDIMISNKCLPSDFYTIK